ncbi:MAG TPA: trypsin-like peptidase domain-containing protein, partial [Ktedonobacterales bacterium]
MEYRPEDTPSVHASEDPSVPTDATAAARGEPAPPRPLPETGQPPLSPGLAASTGGGADPDTMGWRLPSIAPSPGSYPSGSGTDGWSPYGGTAYGGGTEPNLYMPGTSSPYAPPGGWQGPRPGRWQGYRIAAVVGALLVVLLLAGTFALGHQVGASSVTARTTSNGTATIVTLPPSAQDLQQTVITVIHTVQPTVVEVKSQGDFGEAIGSGVIVRQDGYIVTNNHVVQGYSQFTVTLSDGTQQSAQVVGEDAQDDLAVLKITASNLRPIAIADSSKIQVGEFALALGNPLGLEQSATLGIVSALNRTASEGNGGPTLTGLVQTSAPINPGNSGGALVDLQGQLIGIPTLGAANSQSGGAADGIGFA